MIVVFVVDTSPSMGEQIKKKTTAATTATATTTASSSSGMSKLDVAKMTVESISKMMQRRIHDHNTKVQQYSYRQQQQKQNKQQQQQQQHQQQQQQPHDMSHLNLNQLGFSYCLPDQFLLLSTGRQHHQQLSSQTSTTSASDGSSNNSNSESATCGAGGRLIVGFGEYNEKLTDTATTTTGSTTDNNSSNNNQQKHEAFEKELKLLKATTINKNHNNNNTFPEDGGGSNGLNIALSSGLQLLSRYRLHHCATENFGLGRLPSNHHLIPNNLSDTITGGAIACNNIGKQQQQQQQQQQHGQSSSPGSLVQAGNALQPACLILLTDGECLRRQKNEGGGSLQLQFHLPLRELYREPFRWDQRIFCLGIGPTSDHLHPSLKAFCDVTGGCHTAIHDVSNITHATERLLHLIAPSIPSQWPLSNPIPRIPPQPSSSSAAAAAAASTVDKLEGIFVNGGPICCFQQLEMTHSGQIPPMHKAMLLYAPISNIDDASNSRLGIGTIASTKSPPPLWCIPESYFPSKKLDALPPRTALPVLNFARQYSIVGANTFDCNNVISSLHRLDQLVSQNRNLVQHGGSKSKYQQHQNVLQRDVYLCGWLRDGENRIRSRPRSEMGQEHFPVCVRGGGHPSLSEGDENVLNIGILHVPHAHTPSSSRPKPSTLTLLPPDPHILLPLLLKAAEVENRALKKAVEKKEKMSSLDNSDLQQISKNIQLDENWRSEFRAYLFRVPSYYLFSLRRCLRQLLPSRSQSLVSTDSVDSIVSQCFSRQCLQKIRNGLQLSRENVERLERKEEEYRHNMYDVQDGGIGEVGYGQFDKRSQTSNYLNALRQMPPPWKVGTKKRARSNTCDRDDQHDDKEGKSPKSVANSIVNLPHDCLLAYYDSRRRWIFGGSGLTTRGLAVEGVNNCGSNVHRYNANRNLMDESLLTLVGVGASSVESTPISKMGEFKGRLLFSKQSIMGYGYNDSTFSPMTTAADGSPNWSMDDDVLPLGFFDPKTGEFNDNMENRYRTKLMINFGNPYKDKRGDSIVPEAFFSQRPPLRKHMTEVDRSAQGSPPHDAFSTSIEGEGEAVFVKTSPTHKTNFEGDNNNEEEIDVLHDDRTKRHRPNPPRPPPPPPAISKSSPTSSKTPPRTISKPKPPPSMNRPPPPPPPNSKQSKKPMVSNKQKPPPPSKPKQSQPPPPSRQKQGQPPPPSKQKQSQPPPPSKQKQGQLPHPHQIQLQSKGRIHMPARPNDTQSPDTKQMSKTCALKDNETVSTKQAQKPIPPPQEIQSPNVRPKLTLLPGWISVWSKSQRRWYFFDQKTNKSVWEWPPPEKT